MTPEEVVQLAKQNPVKALDVIHADKTIDMAVRNLYGEDYPKFIKAVAINALAAGADPVKVFNEAKTLYPGITSDKEFLAALDKAVYNIALENIDKFVQEYKSIPVSNKLQLSTKLYKVIETGAYKVIECLEKGDALCAATTFMQLPENAKKALRDYITTKPLVDKNGNKVTYDVLVKKLELAYLLHKAKELHDTEEVVNILKKASEIAKDLGLEDLVKEIDSAEEKAYIKELEEKLDNASIDDAYNIISKAPPSYQSLLAAYFIASFINRHKNLSLEDTEKLISLASKYNVNIKVVTVDKETISKELGKLADEAKKLIEETLESGDSSKITEFLEKHKDALKNIYLAGTKISFYDLVKTVIDYVNSDTYRYLKHLAELITELRAHQDETLLWDYIGTVNRLEQVIDKDNNLRKLVEWGILSSIPSKKDLERSKAYAYLSIAKILLDKLRNARNPGQAERYLRELRELVNAIPVVDSDIAKAVASLEINLGGIDDIECSLQALGLLTGGGLGAPRQTQYQVR